MTPVRKWIHRRPIEPPINPLADLPVVTLASPHRHDFACINLREKTWRRAWRYKCPDERDTRHVNRTCAYSDLLCGHRSVSVPPAGWRAAVESEFCEQDGWGADLCSTPKEH